MTNIYLDNNATTPLLPAVREAMLPFLTEAYGNPASAHWAGRQARKALEAARERVAALLGAEYDEVVFTSGATEASNLAIFGLAGSPPGRIITSPIEHPSVSEPLARLGKLGFTLEHLPVDSNGVVIPAALPDLLRPDLGLVTVMLANNETGAIQPVKELSAMLAGRVPFHCDAVQAVGRISVNFHDLDVNTLSLSAHKFHGPKGAGALFLRKSTRLVPQLFGGHQQQGRRPGTESTALAVGLATALELAVVEMESRTAHILKLRQTFLDHLRATAHPIVINGPERDGIPHTMNISFPGCQADSLLMNFDLAGIACSTGSACSSGSLLPSPVLQAMGLTGDVLDSAMRFSLSALLGLEEIEAAARKISAVVARLRESSGVD